MPAGLTDSLVFTSSSSIQTGFDSRASYVNPADFFLHSSSGGGGAGGSAAHVAPISPRAPPCFAEDMSHAGCSSSAEQH
jgi:hypothetical protein